MDTKTAPETRPQLLNTFSPIEKTLMRIGLYGFIAVGGVAIHADNPAWGWGYLAFASLGFIGPVVRYLCAACPYPYTRRTCLFVPHKVITRMYATRRPRVTGWQKAVLVFFFVAVLLAPIPWLVARPIWLALFLVLALPTYGAILLRYCPRCRNTSCPFNRARCPAN